jgi:hypothetical protein
MINNLRWCLLFLAGIQPAIAQQQAALPAITNNGFYNIALTPDIVAASTGNHFSDVRIYEGMAEVPYLLREESNTYDFRAFQILENKQVIRGTSTLLFSNETGLKLDHFEIIVKNTRVKKKISISGSNDKKTWYAVTEEEYFNPETATTDSSGTALISTIHIPVTDYHYYRLLINDSTTAPLNFIKLGRYNIISREVSYLPIPSPKLIKNKLQFDASYLINKLSFTITAPALYHRQATLSTASGPVQQFTLVSGQPAEVVLDNAVKGNEFYLFIDNEDNPPLQISTINAWQANVYLTAYLEKGKTYILKVGDSTLSIPKYDLSYFTDTVKADIPVLHAGKLTRNINAPEIVYTFFKNRYWIWAGIIGINILLGTLAFFMFREMERKKKQ